MNKFNPADVVAAPFTGIDLTNILNLMKRGKYDGLEEAEVIVALSQKIKSVLHEAATAPQKSPQPE